MWKVQFFLLISSCVQVLMPQEIIDVHPDTYLSITEHANKYGYPMETHELTTQDGYMLTLFRIPHGRNSSGVNRKPALVMHGLFGQAENWVGNAMNNGSLAYFLADNEFDVWLGNARGNGHGRKHVTLDPSEPRFWNFSWHEMGKYDLAAKIDYILGETNKDQLYYAGHSQGGAAFMVLCSERPEYQNKIKVAVLFAPAGYMKRTRMPIFRFFSFRLKKIERLMKKYNLYEFPNYENSPAEALAPICIKSSLKGLCASIFEEFNGGVSGELDMRLVPYVIMNLPTIALRQLLHFFQEVVSGHFRQWDYGSPKKNLEIYGTPEPPDYHVENITVPVAIFASKGDNLVDDRDSEELCKNLGNCIEFIVMQNPKWAHIDFAAAIHVLEKVNKPVLQMMNKYDKG